MSRICILTETYYPVIGGGETQAKQLAETLAARGHKVMVLTRRSHPSMAKDEIIGGVQVLRLPPVGKQHYKKWGLLFSSAAALARLRKQYDLVLVSGFRAAGAAAVLTGRLLKKVIVLKADNNGELSGEFFSGGLKKMGLSTRSLLFKFFLPIRNSILRQADAFIAISRQIAAEYASHGVATEKIKLIPNSVDLRLFKPLTAEEKTRLRQSLGLPVNKIIALYTGRLVSYKGLPLLLDVWSQIAAEGRQALLILAGGGSMDIYNCEEELRARVNADGLSEHVIFTGEVRNVAEFLQAADLFVFPTEKEAFGISVIEAMACGLPVAATPVGGLREILTDGVNGLVIQPSEPQQLYAAVNRLIEDRLLRYRLGQAGLKTAREKYSTEIVVDQYAQFFAQAVQAARGRSN